MKNTFHFISAIIILYTILLFSSCKKKETNPDQPAPVAANDSYYGMLYSNQVFFYQAGTLTPVSNGGLSGALFSTSPMVKDGVTNSAFADAGSVSLNGTLFKKSGGTAIYYIDTTYADYNTNFNWTVSGGSGIPAISYSYSVTLPAFTGYSALNNTITLGQANSITLSGITGADEIEVNISSGSISCAPKVVAGNSTSISFSAQDLTGLSASVNGYIYITCYKVSYQTFGGKKIKFKAGYEIIKADVIIQ